MTGPTADSAKKSDFFKCANEGGADNIHDPYDASCVSAFLENPTQEGCTSAIDDDGNRCEWCSLAGMTNLCLTHEQADMGGPLGITCDGGATTTTPANNNMIVRKKENLMSPYDISCIVAYIQEPTQQTCAVAIDQDGNPCQYCQLQGVNLCLTQDQANVGQEWDVTCDAVNEPKGVKDSPYDTSCVLGSFSNGDDCLARTDQAGEPCEWCTVQGIGLCLTSGQADLVMPYAASCEVQDRPQAQDPFDLTCAMAFVNDQSQESCTATTDQDGNQCEYCTLQGAFALCLTEEQAESAARMGIECAAATSAEEAIESDLFDKSCVTAYIDGDYTQDSCVGAKDEDGLRCKYCQGVGAGHVCLTETQADMVTQLGFWCDESNAGEFVSESKVAIPSDFWSCLENYEVKGCTQSSCTWCTSNVGIGFCLADPAAGALKDCSFFDCNYHDSEAATTTKGEDSVDTSCFVEAMKNFDHAQEACAAAVDKDGEPCRWCSLTGGFPVCMTANQAAMAGEYVQCNAEIVASE